MAHSCVLVLKRSKESISTEVDQWMYSKFYPATGKKSESLMDKYLLCEKGSKCFLTKGVNPTIFLEELNLRNQIFFKLKLLKIFPEICSTWPKPRNLTL